MILLDELKTELSSYIPEIKELSDVLNIENSKVELEELRNKAAEPGFWDDLEKSQQVLQKTKAIENKISSLESLSSQLDDLITLTSKPVYPTEVFPERITSPSLWVVKASVS